VPPGSIGTIGTSLTSRYFQQSDSLKAHSKNKAGTSRIIQKNLKIIQNHQKENHYLKKSSKKKNTLKNLSFCMEVPSPPWNGACQAIARPAHATAELVKQVVLVRTGAMVVNGG